MINNFLAWLRDEFFLIWLRIGNNVFKWEYVDVYAPGSEKDPNADVVAVTFSRDEKYLKKVSKIKL